jgi:hypothetical protein
MLEDNPHSRIPCDWTPRFRAAAWHPRAAPYLCRDALARAASGLSLLLVAIATCDCRSSAGGGALSPLGRPAGPSAKRLTGTVAALSDGGCARAPGLIWVRGPGLPPRWPAACGACSATPSSCCSPRRRASGCGARTSTGACSNPRPRRRASSGPRFTPSGTPAPRCCSRPGATSSRCRRGSATTRPPTPWRPTCISWTTAPATPTSSTPSSPTRSHAPRAKPRGDRGETEPRKQPETDDGPDAADSAL